MGPNRTLAFAFFRSIWFAPISFFSPILNNPHPEGTKSLEIVLGLKWGVVKTKTTTKASSSWLRA
jgi:hypothetical protein